MEQALQKIKEAAAGLLYRSESDYPFELVHLKVPASSLEAELLLVATKSTDAKVEKVTLEHFFRNMVKIAPDDAAEQKELVSKYQQLQSVLQEALPDVSVYRIGEVLIDAFIIGKLPDDTYGGLRTKVVET